MRRFIFLIFLSLLFLLCPAKSYASNFTTDYVVNYTVNPSAKTHVSFDVTLTNTSEQYYASSYDMRVGFSNIQNVTASDPDGAITPQVSKTAKGESIELNFNKKAVGLGTRMTFSLSFDTDDVATAIGNVWEINIPGLSNQSDFSSFNVNVFYPSYLGKPASIKPDNSNEIGRIYGNKITFTKSDLGTSGISIAFGDFQIYSFDLVYHLENKNLFPVSEEIALPSKTNYQDVAIFDINPKPKTVTIDSDGNWIAKYNLSPSQTIKIDVKGKSKVYLLPKEDETDQTKLSYYLRPQPYWEVNDTKIKDLGNQLKTAYRIYQYVVDNLTYDFSRVSDSKPREGALGVLASPSSAVCLEFTDLFVSIARAAGIPAREVDGFANTRNTQERPLSLVKDVLHAWPEYYDKDKNMWIMVDPTWGNTTNGIDYFNTLDFDHFAFVVKGVNSSYPVPAGGYKTLNDLSAKDVNVDLSTDFSGSYNLEMNVSLPKESLPGFPITGLITIRNLGSTVSDRKSIKIESSFLKPLQKEIDISQIPPYGYVEIPVNFQSTNLLTNKHDLVTISLDKSRYKQEILISPLVAGKQILGGILGVFAIALSIYLIKSRRLPFLRKG